MNMRDFKIGWRLLIAEPSYSLVVILGLSVGLAACMLLLGFVQYSFGYNAQVPDVDNVYVVKQRFNLDPRAPWFEVAPLQLYLAASQNPMVSDSTAIGRVENQKVKIGNALVKAEFTYVFPHFQDMFNVHAVAGDVQHALERPDGLAITQDTAQHWFGAADALGKSVLVDGHLCTVLAVVANPPANMTMPYRVLRGMSDTTNWGAIFIKLKKGITPAEVTLFLQQMVDSSPAATALSAEQRQRLGKNSMMDIRLTALRDAYFDRDVAGAPFSGPRGDRSVTIALAMVALLVLAMASINYVNLATVRVLRRQREIGIRKLLGASVQNIVTQFLVESVCITMAATLFALILAWLALPLFSELADRNFDNFFSWMNMGICVLSGILLGLLTGAYPAWIALRVAPVRVLAGRSNAETASSTRLRWCLTVLQFATASALTGVALVIVAQVDFAAKLYPGFDAKPLLIVDSHPLDEPQGRAFRDAVARLPGVTGVAASDEAIGRHSVKALTAIGRTRDSVISMQAKSVSSNFFDLYRLRPVAGRLFDPARNNENELHTIVLNPSAVRELGFASPEAAVGQIIKGPADQSREEEQREIIGVIPDLRHESLHEAPVATAYYPANNMNVLSVRVDGNRQQVERAIETLWRTTFPDEEFNMHSAGSFFALDYAEDLKLGKMLAASAGLALSIAGLGIYVLSAYSVRRKEREIVLRKMYGALPHHIGLLILSDSLGVVVAGTLLGLPFAWIATHRYLAGYVEQTPLGQWLMLGAFVGAAAIVLLAALRHTLLAMRISPMIALRG
ncbi:putative ABC transport system permease protein [Oxalobacteraceae bacterium GrIS 1.18]